MFRSTTSALRFGVLFLVAASRLAFAQATLDRPKIAATELNTERTALQEYVDAPDDTYAWKILKKQKVAGATIYVVDLKSQTWRTTADVDRTVWQHWLTVIKPDAAKVSTAMMFIDGGSNGRSQPDGPDAVAVQVAKMTNSIVANVGMIPNQPLVFHGDGEQRGEDNLIGYTWDQYLKTGDESWPARLPMTKAVVRAMDAVQEISQLDDFDGPEVKDFVVAGASKRGWTTWTVGVVDSRVKAIAPIVIDVLNANVSMGHHFSAYGFWAPAIGDYVRHKITHRRHFPRYKELLQLVDPFAYRDQLTMPKCIINATGDQFFLPDSSRFYFDALLGEKHLCYVPNADHSLKGSNAIETLASFHFAIANDVPRPEFSWKFPSDDVIQVETKTVPVRVHAWQATNETARDFRVDTIGRAYKKQEVTSRSGRHYSLKVKEPEEGWTAFFLELEFDIGAATPIRLTTPVRVIPDVLPFADTEPPTIPFEE